MILIINMLYHYPFDEILIFLIKLSILRKLGDSLTTLGPLTIAYRAVDEDFGSYLETFIYLMK